MVAFQITQAFSAVTGILQQCGSTVSASPFALSRTALACIGRRSERHKEVRHDNPKAGYGRDTAVRVGKRGYNGLRHMRLWMVGDNNQALLKSHSARGRVL